MKSFYARKISRIPFKLACPFLPTMMWSCTEMLSGAAMLAIALVIWMSACEGEPLAARAHDRLKLGGWLILTSKGPPHLRRPFVPGWAGDELFQRPCAIEPDQ